MFGACDLSVAAAAEGWGAKTATGVILAVFSVASMLSGLVYGARSWVSPVWQRFVVSSAMLLLSGGLWLAPSPFWLAVAGFAFGVGVSPTMINANAIIRDLVPADRLTEGLTWMATAIGVGVSIGSTSAGLAVDHWGPRSGFAVVFAVAVVTFVLAAASRPTLRKASQAAAPAVW
jgi:MFS family permease